ncbi:DEKNAAC103646 [Brettanomyces naardenensis]|uniref:Small ribosomal subunit protein mS29 n=1 Tax=Brettanomyces naardenensis TaxID=13370 RepID=A0A448YN69_BRENA|nr:DEKNAAC103646 [Brettanomyces naardenensis]
MFGVLKNSSSKLTPLSVRCFTTGQTSLAIAAARKSFNKKASFDRSKHNRKGQGSEKTFVETLKSSNFKTTAKDAEILEKLPTLTVQNLRLGEVVRYNDENLRKMFVSGSFKAHQFNELYSKPTTLIRPTETVKLADFYSNSIKEEHSRNNRLILTGPTGVGKSTALSQFQAMALGTSGGAILIAVPNAESIVDGSSDFKYNNDTGLYDQQMLARTLLRKLIAANKDLLSEIKISADFVPVHGGKKQQETQKLTKGKSSVLDLALLGVGQQINSTHVFTTIVQELSTQTTYPVFITLDNLSAFVQFGMTAYRDTHNDPIYFQKLQIAKTLLDYLSGESTFAKGAIVAATRGSDKHSENDTIPVGLGLKDPNLYKKFDNFDRNFAEVLAKNGGAKNLEVSKLSVDECRALLAHMISCDVIHNEYQMAEELESLGQEEYLRKLAERKYLISGNGNARLFLESCVLAYV